MINQKSVNKSVDYIGSIVLCVFYDWFGGWCCLFNTLPAAAAAASV